MARKQKQVGVLVDDRMYELVATEALLYGVSFATVVRWALKEHFHLPADSTNGTHPTAGTPAGQTDADARPVASAS